MVAGVLLALAASAHAAFPGTNGKIAFQHVVSFGSADIYVVNPDGSGVVNLTNTPTEYESHPAWSPDGRFIAFVKGDDIYWMRANGSGLTRLSAPSPLRPGLDWSADSERLVFSDSLTDGLATIEVDGTNFTGLGAGVASHFPSWSPDGTRIAFTEFAGGPNGTDIHTIKPDGTDEQIVTTGPNNDERPDWSPDGTRIAFRRDQDLIYTVKPDGTDLTPVPGSELANNGHAWSPDGQKLALGHFVPGSDYDIYTMDAAGGDPSPVFSSPAIDAQPDWQPAPPPAQPGHVRPKGASPIRVSLVPAYLPCEEPNRTHGPPLAFSSCGPPQPQSSLLTVGTADSNGASTKSIGFVRFRVFRGDPSTLEDEADVAVEVDMTDVRCRLAGFSCTGGALSDYTGELQGRATLRITDRYNGPVPDDPATTEDIFPFTWPVPCSPTPDTTVGSSCSIDTTLEALRPGSVVEQKRSVWQLDQIEIRDGGVDDFTLFAVQGVFVP
jgi:Tol biopolymer transport system component